MSALSGGEREALRLLHAPLDDTTAVECRVCRHVRVVEAGTVVSCQHGGDWIPMAIAADQVAARARVKTQVEASTIAVQEPLR
ncbi:MAG: hypothetical protein ACRDM7_22770 [Thermoleophilaceae bacterium]